MRTSVPGFNNSSWMCLLSFYPCFATEPRLSTELLVLQTVSRFATKPRFVTEPCFATAPCGTVQRNMWVRCDEMCWFGVTKYADVVRQNVVDMLRQNVRVRCVKVCGYNAKCRNGATECGNGAMVTKWRPRVTTDRQDLYLRTVVIIFIKNLHFNRWHWFAK